MADDILDYMAEEKAFGKNLGKDLEEGKITLPLLYLLRSAEKNETERIKEIISAGSITENDLADIQGMFSRHNSIEQSYERAHSLLDEAKAELDIFDDSMEKQSLLAIADYAVKRKK
jgi:octaprenyl-diphosphate synthase